MKSYNPGSILSNGLVLHRGLRWHVHDGPLCPHLRPQMAQINSFSKSAKCYASFAPSGTSDVHLTVEYDYKTGRFIMNGDIFPDKDKKYELNNDDPQYKEFLKFYAKKFLIG